MAGSKPGRGDRRYGSVKLWKLAAWGGILAIVGLLLWMGAVGGSHGPDAGRAMASALAVDLSAPAQASAPGSCPFSGPLGGLNGWEAGGLIAVVLVGGVGIGWVAPRPGRSSTIGSGTQGGGSGRVAEPPDPALNPQPLPPGMLPPDSARGPVGVLTPDLNPQPLPPGVFRPGPSGGPGAAGGGTSKVTASRKAGGGNTPGQESLEADGEAKA